MLLPARGLQQREKEKKCCELFFVSLPYPYTISFNDCTNCKIMTLRQISYISTVKRIASILLLSLFLFNIVGYYFLFIITSSENRNEMQSNLLQSSLETIRIPKTEMADIIFKDGGKEISFNGEMYDVKDKSIDGNYIVFHCVNDKRETKLFTQLDKQVKYNTDSKSSSEKKHHNSKNPVKDLFFLQKKFSALVSYEFEFSIATCNLTSLTATPLPLPPPEVSAA